MLAHDSLVIIVKAASENSKEHVLLNSLGRDTITRTRKIWPKIEFHTEI